MINIQERVDELKRAGLEKGHSESYMNAFGEGYGKGYTKGFMDGLETGKCETRELAIEGVIQVIERTSMPIETITQCFPWLKRQELDLIRARL